MKLHELSSDGSVADLRWGSVRLIVHVLYYTCKYYILYRVIGTAYASVEIRDCGGG